MYQINSISISAPTDIQKKCGFPDAALEPSTDGDDSSEYYETAPESQPNASDDDDNDDSPPCAGACAITVDYFDDNSDLSDLEGSGATIMDLSNDPHLDCCILRPGELGEP